jgi:hypothetical protein
MPEILNTYHLSISNQRPYSLDKGGQDDTDLL